jgi:hypothetical protein
MHFGTFPLADEGMGTAEAELRKCLAESEFAAEDFIIPEEGKTYIFPSSGSF